MLAPEIGRRLYLSPATVKSHLQSLYDKLGVSDRAAAVAEAMRRGLLE
jgi:two-component system nitrate/nitrite response regulator NarL